MGLTKQKIVLAGVYMLCSFFLEAQQSLRNVREQVFLHINGTDLIVGETLLFSAYVYSMKSGKVSDLSSILYVELIDAAGNAVHQTKISLSKGRGNGHYFIPSLLSTGHYRLVAYTRWMKNFGDYFEQRITIINPFEEYQQPEVAQDTVLLFYPEGGNLVEGQENNVVIRIAMGRKGVQYSGRLVAKSGEQVGSFETSDLGLGEFQLTPIAGESYQVVLEKENDFAFYDVPGPCRNCASLSIEQVGQQVTVSVRRGPDLVRDEHVVQLVTAQNIWMERTLEENNTITWNTQAVPEGVSQIRLMDSGGNVISTRLIHIGTRARNEKGALTVTGRRKQLTVPFFVPKGSTISASVKKVNMCDVRPDFDYTYRLRSGVSEPLPPSFFATATDQDIRRMLIMSKARREYQEIKTVRWMPEVRHDLQSGTVTSNSEDLAVSLAVSGDINQYKLSPVNAQGRFTITFKSPYEQATTVLNQLGGDVDDQIVIHNEFYENYPEISTDPLAMDSARVQEIIARSVRNQIENAYFISNKDTREGQSSSQFGDAITYWLDDYTRFPTVRDTFLEYIPEIGISKNENDFNFTLKIVDFIPSQDITSYPTVLLLDGMPISKKQILELSPFLIERIEIINKQYYFGSVAVDGIISLQSIDPDVSGHEPTGQRHEMIPIEKGHPGINVQDPDYTNPRLPDQREQLFWDPGSTVKNDTYEIDLYTSEVPGTYQIHIVGIDPDGGSISIHQNFTVQ